MSLDFPKEEEKILKFWQEKKIFEKLRKKIKGKKPWSFLDGPITANNPMGVHHAWGRSYKDLFQRYKAMQGFDLRFQNGFDCQGLWVEVEVEKELGFKTKKEIEKYGIERFVEKCKERVKKYSKIQTEQSIRLGQWMDWQNSYYTMSDENNYAIWYFLKKCWQKNLLYKGRDVVPWCPRCGTAISQHEILTEEYQEILHKAIYLKFPISNNKTYFLVWTTTPWTLPANVALAVSPDLPYLKVQSENGENFILLKEKANLIQNSKIVEEFNGKELEGLEYQGIFDELQVVKEVMRNGKHKVILWDGVSAQEGTGIVHIAPGCGQEDFQLSKKYNLPVIDPTNDESCYKEGFGFLTGRLVGEVAELIFQNLKEKGLVFKIEDYRHRYPVCWRCKSELIFRLVDEWYIKMDPLRKLLIEIAKKIQWIPPFGLEREIDWLKNMKDWLISKKRYWGLSLPIFECKNCGSFEVIGSKKELKERAVKGWELFSGHSPHRPWIDKVKIRCSKCGKIISRIPDVGNPWLDAGIVPFSTINEENICSINRPELKDYLPSYFRDKKYWKLWFPAELVCESFPGQFRNWFYSLIAMSALLEKKRPTKRVFGYALVRDEKGEEMHKSKGNVIWLDQALEKIGADVMRWLYFRQNISLNLKFGYKVAEEIKRKLMFLENSFVFFETYVSKKELNFVAKKFFGSRKKIEPKNLLDKWIISRLNYLISKVTNCLEGYKISQATLSIEKFIIEDLSLWYIRRVRKKFQNPKTKEEKIESAATLYYVLLKLLLLLAPFLPFLSERNYQKIKVKGFPESIHLWDWPKADKKSRKKELEKKIIQVREIVSQALALRVEKGIKVRQPLLKLKIKNKKLILEKELLNLIKEEVNVKKIIFDDKIKGELELDTRLTPELLEEGTLREFIRNIQDLRKRAGLKPKDKIEIIFFAPEDLKEIFFKGKRKILKETRAKNLVFKEKTKAIFEFKKEIQIGKKEVFLAIKRV